MNREEIKEFKQNVVDCLVKKHHMTEFEAFKAVRDSYLSKMLKWDSDFVMHDTVEEWAKYIFQEHEEEILLEM